MESFDKSSENRALSPLWRSNAVWHIVIGGAIGAAATLALRVGWVKLAAWARNSRADYSKIADESVLASSASGGILGSLFSINALSVHPPAEQTSDKRFTKQIAEEQERKTHRPMVLK